MFRRTMALWLGIGTAAWAADPVWRSSGGESPKPLPVVPASIDAQWKPSGADIVPVKFEEPVMLPAVPQVDLPKVPEVAPPPKVEPVPTPLPVPKFIPEPPMPKYTPPFKTGVAEVVKPAPVEAKPLRVHAPVSPIVHNPPPDESTAVWGAYNQGRSTTLLAGTSVASEPAPMRHHTFGSPSLRLSRDYHFLDGLKKSPLAANDENGVLVDDAAVNNDWFVSGEYLLWWVNNGTVPVLATTATGQNFGYIGQPGTTNLIGPGPFGQTQRNGFRIRGGKWLDDEHSCGIDASLFVLGSVSTTTTIGSDQFPTIARPFYSVNFGREFSELVAFPGLSTGRLEVESDSFLWGADVNYKRCCGCDAAWFVGYRYLSLQESLTITEYITAGANAPDPAGTSIVVRDQFRTKNSFNGGQAGGYKSWRYDNWSFDARGSIALGVTTQTLSIEGVQARTRPGQDTQYFTGGLLAVGPNLGTFDNNEFSVVPEATLAVGYYVRPNIKLYAGYNFMAWTGVLRPGDSIDRVIDLNYVPNAPTVPFAAARPQPVFNSSTLVINGIQFGIEGSW